MPVPRGFADPVVLAHHIEYRPPHAAPRQIASRLLEADLTPYPFTGLGEVHQIPNECRRPGSATAPGATGTVLVPRGFDPTAGPPRASRAAACMSACQVHASAALRRETRITPTMSKVFALSTSTASRRPGASAPARARCRYGPPAPSSATAYSDARRRCRRAWLGRVGSSVIGTTRRAQSTVTKTHCGDTTA